MMNTSKTVGYILLGIGAVLLLAVIAWAMTYPFEQASTRILPIIAALIVCAPLIGLGIYTLTKGTAESDQKTARTIEPGDDARQGQFSHRRRRNERNARRSEGDGV
jgi:lysylphosphatidylglycerol synthetase-like protein (DUF2156 family)